MKAFSRILLCALSAAAGALIGTWLYAGLVPAPKAPPPPPPASPNASALQDEFAAAVRRAMPAVVSIAPVKHNADAGSDLRELDGSPLPAPGTGTGFFIRKEGYILTDETVIRACGTWFVTTMEGREYPARYIGADPVSGLAVLKIDGRNDFPVLRPVPAAEIRTGHWVLALGAADGIRSAAAGITSAIPSGRIPAFLSTAACTRLNLGGPLIDTQCRLLGLLQGGIPGAPRAVQAETAEKIAAELIRSGSIPQPWLGLAVSAHPDGLYVHAVAPHSPAADSLERGDIILTAGKRPVRSATAMQELLMRTGAGNELELSLRRDGRTVTGPLRTAVSPANWFRQLPYPAGVQASAL